MWEMRNMIGLKFKRLIDIKMDNASRDSSILRSRIIRSIIFMDRGS